jgi:hypothetical protein
VAGSANNATLRVLLIFVEESGGTTAFTRAPFFLNIESGSGLFTASLRESSGEGFDVIYEYVPDGVTVREILVHPPT